MCNLKNNYMSNEEVIKKMATRKTDINHKVTGETSLIHHEESWLGKLNTQRMY